MCDSLLARGARTVDGATLFAKSSERPVRESQPFIQLPAAFHPRGSQVRCTHVEIDQVAETYRVMGHSPVWCWGFAQGVNEFGVAIGCHATRSREPLEQAAGLIGMDLVRLGLERGRDAREALEIIATLIEMHGQGGAVFDSTEDPGCQNSFAIADGRSVWVLETTARRWAARSAEGVRLSNALTLGADWEIGSRDLERHAAENGYWRGPGRLDFRAAYACPDGACPDGWEASTRRQGGARPRDSPRSPLSLETAKQWLGERGRGADSAGTAHGEPDSGRSESGVSAHPVSMRASLVVRIPETGGARPWPVWIGFDVPCMEIFVPVYLEGVLPASLAASSEDSMWASMRALRESAAADSARALPRLRAGWGRIASEIESDRAQAEAEAAVLADAERMEESADTLTRFMTRTTDLVLETSRRLAGSD